MVNAFLDFEVRAVHPIPLVLDANGGVARRGLVQARAYDDAGARASGRAQRRGGPAGTHLLLRHLHLRGDGEEDVQQGARQHGDLARAGLAPIRPVDHFDLPRRRIDGELLEDPRHEAAHRRHVASLERQEDARGLLLAPQPHPQDARFLQSAQAGQQPPEVRRAAALRGAERMGVLERADRLRHQLEQDVDRDAALDQRDDVRRREWPEVGLDEVLAGHRVQGEGRPVGVLRDAQDRGEIAVVGRRIGVQAGLRGALEGVARHRLRHGKKGRRLAVAHADQVEEGLPLAGFRELRV